MSTHTTSKTPLDLTETTQKMVDAAVAVTTGRLHLRSPAEACGLLQAGDPAAVSHFRFELARQIAAALMMMDSQVIAVFEDGNVPDDEVELASPIHVVVHVKHRTAALQVVIGALDQALCHALAEVAPERPQTLIEAIVVDNRNSRLLDARRDSPRSLPRLLTHRD